MKKFFWVFLAVLTLGLMTGCATNEYGQYTEALVKIETKRIDGEIAKYNAKAAKYLATATIAEAGTDTAKVAGMFSLAMDRDNEPSNGGNSNTVLAASLRPPESFGDKALKWGSLIIPSLTQFYGIKSNTDLGMRVSDNNAQLGMRQSDNNFATSQSTNNAFVGIASKIQAPAVVLPQANVTTTTTSTVTSDNHSINSSYNPTTTDSYPAPIITPVIVTP